MLSSLGRNGFVESLSVTKQHGSAVGLRRRLCTRNNGFALTAEVALWRNDRLPPRMLASRFYSAPTSTDTPKSHGTQQPIPQPTKKSKVELRPGPVKAAKPASAPAETSTASKAPASQPASESSASTSAAEESHPIEVTKKDLADAVQHGILAPPPEGAGMIRRLVHHAKEFFKFYWRGLKLIETNRRRAKALRERVTAGGPPLTRAELRFVRTNREDLLKLIPFALIILIAEEIIPLVVLYAPFLLPSTCVMPSQKQRIDAKRRAKQKATALEMFSTLELAGGRLADASSPIEASLDSYAQKAFTGVLGLSMRGPSVMRLNRLKRHLAAVAEDDALLRQEDLGKRLSVAELQEALDERGIFTEDLPETTWLSRMQWWLSQVEAPGATDPVRQRLLVVASSATGKY